MKKQLYIKNKNIKRIIITKVMDILQYSLCAVDDHRNSSAVNAGETLQFSPVQLRRILSGFQNETTVKR
jgi:hypothetical protein